MKRLVEYCVLHIKKEPKKGAAVSTLVLLYTYMYRINGPTK